MNGQTRRPRAPRMVDFATPNVARMQDVYLGGKDSFAADRELAREAMCAAPDLSRLARAQRAFLERAVRYAVGQGIRQFLDIGAGFPRADGTYEVARVACPPGARVWAVDVDVDPMVVAHGQALLSEHSHTAMVRGDLRYPEEILKDREVCGLLDFSRPVALVLVNVVHHLPDRAEPWQVVAELLHALAPGSLLILSHATGDIAAEQAVGAARVYERASAPLVLRDWDRIAGFFTGLELVRPGLVPVAKWTPFRHLPIPGDRLWAYAGVGRKPGSPPHDESSPSRAVPLTGPPSHGVAIRARA